MDLVKCNVLRHISIDNMTAISQTTSSNAFLWMKSLHIWFNLHRSLLLSVQFTIIQQWFRKCRTGGRPLPEPWLLSSPTHICVIRGDELIIFVILIFVKAFRFCEELSEMKNMWNEFGSDTDGLVYGLVQRRWIMSPYVTDIHMHLYR